MYSLLKMGIFHCHVSFLQGILLMVQKSGFHQLRLVLEILLFTGFFYIQGGAGFLPTSILGSLITVWGFGKAQWRQWTNPSKCIIEVGRGEMASEIIHQVMARCVFSLYICGKLCCINEDFQATPGLCQSPDLESEIGGQPGPPNGAVKQYSIR